MADRDRSGDTPPRSFAETTPPDLYATSDIRFVMLEIGKLTSKVDRLLSDVASSTEKLDALRHSQSFMKGVIAVGSIIVTGAIAIGTFLLNGSLSHLLELLAKLQH